jgi:hypothetical protein
VAVGGTSADRARSHTPRHVSHFQRIYTDEQKAAVAEAFEDRRIRPATRVADLAKAGELRYQGQLLDPFNIEEATVRHEARMLRKRRAGQLTSKLSDVPARDAVEQLRRRMVNLADAELTVLERQKAGSRNPEIMRQFVRLLRELQAVPGRDEQRKPAPGQRSDGQREGAETTGGMGGRLLKAHRQSEGATAQDAPTPQNTSTENSDAAQRSAHDAAQEEAQEDDAPRSLARAAAERALSIG